jgi:hypothetical protein
VKKAKAAALDTGQVEYDIRNKFSSHGQISTTHAENTLLR